MRFCAAIGLAFAAVSAGAQFGVASDAPTPKAAISAYFSCIEAMQDEVDDERYDARHVAKEIHSSCFAAILDWMRPSPDRVLIEEIISEKRSELLDDLTDSLNLRRFGF